MLVRDFDNMISGSRELKPGEEKLKKPTLNKDETEQIFKAKTILNELRKEVSGWTAAGKQTQPPAAGSVRYLDRSSVKSALENLTDEGRIRL